MKPISACVPGFRRVLVTAVAAGLAAFGVSGLAFDTKSPVLAGTGSEPGALPVRVAALAPTDVPGTGPDAGWPRRAATGLAPERQLSARDDAALARADPADRQLAEYARQVGDMGFLRLYGDRALQVIAALPAMLGEGAANVDYEHDATQREALLELQMQRIALMVREGIPSATLFKIGAGSRFEQRYLCVVTLDTKPLREDPAYASRFMAPASAADRLEGTGALLIRNEDFLQFTVDHEVFHCLDAYYNGPTIHKTRDSLQHLYNEYLNEARADAFASQSFRRRTAAPEEFLRMFAALRDLALVDMDLPHFTGDVIRQSINAPAAGDAPWPSSMVTASRALAAASVLRADQFGAWVASAMLVPEQLGQPSAEPPQVLGDEARLPEAEDSTVVSLLNNVLRARCAIRASTARADSLAIRLDPLPTGLQPAPSPPTETVAFQ